MAEVLNYSAITGLLGPIAQRPVDEAGGGTGGDALDIGSILPDFEPGKSLVADFVRFDSSAGDTIVAVDDNGGGKDCTALVGPAGVNGLNLKQSVRDGNFGLT